MGMVRQLVKCGGLVWVLCWATISSDVLASSPYYWVADNDFGNTHYSSPSEACNEYKTDWYYCVDGMVEPYVDSFLMVGYLYRTVGNGRLGSITFYRQGDSCRDGEVYNFSSGACGNDEQKGVPPPDSCVGNPINIAVGNKFQVEVDYQSNTAGGPSFIRSYNSLDALWRQGYAMYIRFAVGRLSLVQADGRDFFFDIEGDIVKGFPTEIGTLAKVEDNWLYTSTDNQRYSFDAKGRLTEWVGSNGLVQTLSYNGNGIAVSGGGGQSFFFTEDSLHQPLSLTADGLSIKYEYDSNKHLVQLTRTYGARTERRQFHYEDSRNTGLLTGITDERGIRFATWAYDEKGRAISSQHSGGAGLTHVAYNADGSSTVTNELGKTTVYQYQQIGGIKRVTSIKGEPSANCPSSNSSYTYNDRGLVLTKTDAKGLITTYSYNDRGLEISRTEATGTTLARTTTTEWDPDRFLPIKVIEPNRITVYSYDNQGRELTRQSTSR